MNLFGFVENLALKVSKTTLIAISFFVIVLGVHKEDLFCSRKLHRPEVSVWVR